MDDKKKTFGAKLEQFFAGRGFYVVLLLCVGVIGASTWAMLAPGDTAPVKEVAGSVVTLHPATPPSWSGSTAGTAQAPRPATQPDPSPVPPESATPDSGEANASYTEPDTAVPVTVTEPDPVPVAAETPQDSGYAVWNEQETPAAQQYLNEAYIWPIMGETLLPYSMDELVYNKTMGDWRTHDGIDIAAEPGAVVMAVSSGTVERVYDDALYGTTVVIDHRGNVRSVYSNLQDTPTVMVGDSVTGGEVIGAVGASAMGEASESPHLHFCMSRDGAPVDPAEYLG